MSVYKGLNVCADNFLWSSVWGKVSPRHREQGSPDRTLSESQHRTMSESSEHWHASTEARWRGQTLHSNAQIRRVENALVLADQTLLESIQMSVKLSGIPTRVYSRSPIGLACLYILYASMEYNIPRIQPASWAALVAQLLEHRPRKAWIPSKAAPTTAPVLPDCIPRMA